MYQRVRPAELKTIAIYHASFQIVKRSVGRSAVAAASYRSGERLVDERTGEIHDYSRKRGVDDTFIMTPADAPEWASDRESLWSTVELTEKRKDAQLARELNVALPVELSQSESTALIRDYVQAAFVDQGMIADVALHELDSDNPHAHVMLTLRELDGDAFGKKNRDWNAKPLMQEWREQWAHKSNAHLEKAGHEVRIDHRSLEAQGLERMPTIHVGVHASAMEKRGVKTERGNHNRQVMTINQALGAIVSGIEKGMKLAKHGVVGAAETINSALSAQGSVLQAAVARKEARREREREQERARQRSLDRGRDGLTR